MPWSTVYEIRQCAVDELVTLSLGVAGTKRTERHPTQSLLQRVMSRGVGVLHMVRQATHGTQCCVPCPRSSLVIYAYHVNNINNTNIKQPQQSQHQPQIVKLDRKIEYKVNSQRSKSHQSLLDTRPW